MKKISLSIVLGIFCLQAAISQNRAGMDKVLSHVKKDITIGAGFNAVYDTGLRGPEKTSGDSWNFSNPFYVSGEYYLSNVYSVVSILSLNKYEEGKYIDGYFISNNSSANFIAFDVAGKYSFRELFKWSAIEPYALSGLGVNSIGEYDIDNGPVQTVVAETRVNAVLGAGSNYWITPYWAININFSYKIGIGKDIGDQFQPSIGAVYKLTN